MMQICIEGQEEILGRMIETLNRKQNNKILELP